MLSHVIFTPLSAEAAKAYSAVQITNPRSVVEFKKNGGFHDTRMGAFKNILCQTCKGGQDKCPGHFGHIVLSAPVINPHYLKTNLKKILNALCFSCLKIQNCTCKKTEMNTKKRKVNKSTFKTTTQNLNYRNAGLKFAIQDFQSQRHVSIATLYEKLKQVETVEYRKIFPTKLQAEKDLTDFVFIKNLLVLPTCARPPNFSDGIWRPDNITRLYLNVLRLSDMIRMKTHLVDEKRLNEYHQRLQSAVNILFDTENTNANLKQSTATNGGLRQRIDGKHGRIRLNLMGKRVEFSARTVLSGDPNLAINQVGVPAQIAKNLTVPVIINHYNIQRITSWKIRYVTCNGQRFDVSVSPEMIYKIRVGDTIERQLIDGDIVCVNRQPTLHRGSMIACYVKIFPQKTFRLNYSTMVTLNADTDGDEINIHVPQDLHSRAELEELMLASTNIVCSQSSKPLVGCTQDSLLGCYQLSLNKKIHWVDFMDLLYKSNIENVHVQRRYYKGVEIVDFILEKLKIQIDFFEIENHQFKIINSHVIDGILDKKVVGSAENSLIHYVYLANGHLIAAQMIHLLQKAASAYLDIDGFSVGIQDCVVQHDKNINHQALEQHLQDADHVDEEALMEVVSKVTQLEPPHVPNNNLLAMIKSGAKGSIINFNQITNILGQQNVGNSRVPFEFASSKSKFADRTLPHFRLNDDKLYSKGFITRNYLQGLKPHEFFFHAMSGRIGLIDTSCKTADTGSLMRRLVKSLENAQIMEDVDGNRIVFHKTTKNIISFCYGGDNFDATFLKRKKNLQ